MPKHPAKQLVDLVEKVRGELDEKFRGGRGEVNVFYRDDGGTAPGYVDSLT